MATDYDGTLSPIVASAADVQTIPASLDALRVLVRRVLRVAVISGRATADLERVLPLEGALMLGDYGLGTATPEERSALASFNRDLRGAIGATGAVVEEKTGSTSVHFRAHPDLADTLWQTVEPLAERHGLKASRGRLVVEVVPPRAGKGAALENLVKRVRPSGALFAGDDVGDRAAFEALRGLHIPHLAIGVRSSEAPPDLFDACDLVVDGPEAFSRFLTALAAWADRPGPARPGSDA